MTEHPSWANASNHDSDCEREYTTGGYIFIDCLCHMRRVQADAWDEGYLRGTLDTTSDLEPADNPYVTRGDQ